MTISCAQSSDGLDRNQQAQNGQRTDDSKEGSENDDIQSIETDTNESILMDPSVNGRLKYDFYDTGLESDAYNSARIYYPLASDQHPGPFPATTTSGGFLNTKENMYWFAERMASHGFIVIVFTPTNNNSLDPEIWNTGHQGGIAMLELEAMNADSPIFMQVDGDKLGVSGFSMGGAGTILAANDLGDKIKVAAPFNAFSPPASEMSAATIFVAGSLDTVAASANIETSYNSLQESPKLYANFQGYAHSMTAPGRYKDDISTYVVSWYQLHMNGNTDYNIYLTGTKNQEDLQGDVFVDGGYQVVLD